MRQTTFRWAFRWAFGWVAIISFLMVIGSAMGSLSTEPYSVSGRLHFPEGFSLPSDAIATITLTDVSPLQDISATMIARQVIHPPHEQSTPFELPFELIVDPDEISDHHLYAIQARVASAGRVILTNSSAYPVITQGHPTVVEVYVESSASGAKE